MKKFKILVISLMILSFVIVGVGFVYLPDIIPIHFGIDGAPDEFGSKYFMLLFPTVITIVGGVALAVCRYAKVSENYKKYTMLTVSIVEAIFVVLLVMLLVYATMYTEDDFVFEISKIMLPLFGLMFIILGNFMPKIEKNSTLGVKTYWSMYNETTWQKTHRFTGFVSVVVGVLSIVLGLFFNDIVNFIILMSLIFVFVVSTTVASYIYYKQEKQKELE